MAKLEADLELIITEALDAVEDLGKALDSVIEDFGDNVKDALDLFDQRIELDVDTREAARGLEDLLDLVEPIELDVTADTDAAITTLDEMRAEQISENLDVLVTADTKAFVDEIEAARFDVESISTTVEVGVNIEVDDKSLDAALEKINELEGADVIEISIDADGGSLDEVSEQMGDLGDTIEETSDSSAKATPALERLFQTTDAISGVAAAAQGEVGGFVNAVTDLVPASKGASIAILSFIGTTTLFFEAGLRATASYERLDIVFKDLASDVTKIDIGGLSGNLSDLAKEAGSSGGKLRDAAAAAGELAIASGASRQEAVEYAEKLNALALRAVAIKPALGEAGDVSERLGTTLARGGRLLARYGISLTTAEINQRAMTDTNKAAVKDLTQYEKSLAGAELATEKLGKKLGKDFAEGSEQAAVQMKSLKAEINSAVSAAGMPLVSPILEILKALAPIAVDLSGIISGQLVVAFNILSPILSGIGNAFSLVSGILENIPPQMLTQLLLVTKLGGGWGIFLAAMLPLLELFGDDVMKAVGFVGALAFAFYSAIKALKAMNIALLSSPWGIALAGLSMVVAGLSQAVKGTDNYDKGLKEMTETTDAAARAQIFWASGFGSQKSAIERLTQLMGDNVDAAQDVGKALVAAGTITEKEYNRVMSDAAKATEEATQAEMDNVAATKMIPNAAQEAAAAQEILKQKMEALAQTFTAVTPTLEGSLNSFLETVRQVFGEEAIPPIESFINSLGKTITDTRIWLEGIRTLNEQGFGGLAAIVTSAGRGMGSAWSVELNAMSFLQREKLNNLVTGSFAAMEQLRIDAIAYGGNTAKALSAQLGISMTDAEAIIAAGTAALAGTAGTGAAVTSDAFKKDLKISDKLNEQMDKVIATFEEKKIALLIVVSNAAVQVGGKFGTMLSNSITGQRAGVNAAGNELAHAAIKGARERMENIKSVGADGARGMRDGMINHTEAANVGGRSLANAAREGASTFTGHGVGRNAAEGMRNGLIEGIARVREAGQRLGAAARRGVEITLTLRSPSLVMRKLGRQTGEGFALGLEDMTARVADAAIELTSSVLSPQTYDFNAQLSSSTSGQSSPRAGETLAGAAPLVGVMNVVGQDPRATATAVGRELAFQRRFQGGA